MKKIFLEIQLAKNKKVKAYILDLSRLGMGIAAVSRLRKGLNIDITPKNELLPKLQAEIVYVSKLPRKIYNYRTGIRFINLNKKQQSYLDKFINKLKRIKKTIKFI